MKTIVALQGSWIALLISIAMLSCQKTVGNRTSAINSAVRDRVPKETPREFLPQLVQLELPGCKFPNEENRLKHVTDFVRPWAPYSSTLFGAWRAVVEEVKYDQHKLYKKWYAQSPVFTWRTKRGICIDTATLLCAWLLKQGENAFVALGDAGETRSGLAWVIVRDSEKKETLIMETAVDGDLPPNAVRKLPPQEHYRIHALFNDRHIFVSEKYRNEYEHYLDSIIR